MCMSQEQGRGLQFKVGFIQDFFNYIEIGHVEFFVLGGGRRNLDHEISLDLKVNMSCIFM